MWNLKSSVKFLSLVSLKSIGISCPLNGSFTVYGFVTSCIGNLETIVLVSYIDPSNVYTFHILNNPVC